jgi:anti-anti-sigma regulatory factor
VICTAIRTANRPETSVSNDNDTIDFELPDDVGIYEVGELYRDLGGALQAFIDATGSSGRHTLRLGAQRVAMIDTAGLQLLLAVAAELQSRGLALRLITPSSALRGVVDRLGANALLDLPPLAQAA